MENYSECTVKRKKGAKVRLLRTLIIAVSALLSGILFFFFMALGMALGPWGVLSLLVLAGVFYAGWLLYRSFDKEFEYILSDSEMCIDTITARARRKRLLTVDLKSIEAMAPLREPARPRQEEAVQVVNASAEDGSPAYYIRCRGPRGRVMVLLNPNEAILRAVRRYAPQALANG